MSYNSLVQTGECEAMVMYATTAARFDGWMRGCSTNTSTVYALKFNVTVGQGCLINSTR